MYSEVRLSGAATLWRSAHSAGRAVIPADGCVDLILRDGRVDVAGPSTRWLETAPDGTDGSTGVRLAPGHAAHVLRIDLATIADQLVPLDDLAAAGHARRLRETMLRAADRSGRKDAVSRIAALGDESPRWIHGARRSAYDAVSARDAAASLQISERTFRRRMLMTFGYGYAALVRLERARRAQRVLRSGSSIADAAAAAGFADQPHLSREFQRLVGRSPAQFASQVAVRVE
ncbi:helix-turn-helix domain-containing protein [Microbacterium arborescens]|uniref:helix-turn-helix domain-containing protein n=1 Tax=Microbacterium arborescens TaxID=33883 RepID=UPI0025A11987|nr:helix-turn-helix domain-containing protein [Microbacterium arborescens]WJM15690.1 helix-turn-helix domain-containing protein [Microbacterium arborescens]